METIEQINIVDSSSIWQTYKGFEVITNKHIYRFFTITGKNQYDQNGYFKNMDPDIKENDYKGAKLKHIKITNMRGQPARMRKSMFTLGGRYKWHTGMVRSITLDTNCVPVVFKTVNQDGTIGHDSIVTCEKRRNQ